MKKLILCIDFDGTVVDHEYPQIGKLKKDVKNVINSFYDMGHKIIIWTCRYEREDLDVMIDFLRQEGIKYHKINENVEECSFRPSPKVYGDLYIDDHNVGGMLEWKEIYKWVCLKSIEES